MNCISSWRRIASWRRLLISDINAATDCVIATLLNCLKVTMLLLIVGAGHTLQLLQCFIPPSKFGGGDLKVWTDCKGRGL